MIVRQRFQVPTRSVDQAFDQMTRSFFEGRTTGPTMRANWVDDQYVLTVDLPGVPADAVKVEVVGDQLHLNVTSDEFGTDRTLKMHSQLDPNKVVANYADGRLTVTIGKVDTPEPRSIEIDLTPAAPAIDTTSVEVDASGDTDGEAEDHSDS